VHRIGVEHSPHQSRNTYRLARFRDHAANAFTKTDLRARAILGITARRDRDEHVFFFGRHEDHRMLEAEAFVKPFENRINQPFEAVRGLYASGDVVHRLHREHRTRRDRAQIALDARCTFVCGFLGSRLDRSHLVNVGRAQLEDSF
jgi:hypothetical protein